MKYPHVSKKGTKIWTSIRDNDNTNVERLTDAFNQINMPSEADAFGSGVMLPGVTLKAPRNKYIVAKF